jgi:hypothetical protein
MVSPNNYVIWPVVTFFMLMFSFRVGAAMAEGSRWPYGSFLTLVGQGVITGVLSAIIASILFWHVWSSSTWFAWLLCNIVGASLTTILGHVCFNVILEDFPLPLGWFLLATVMINDVLGIAQWWVLRRSITHSGWWVAAVSASSVLLNLYYYRMTLNFV